MRQSSPLSPPPTSPHLTSPLSSPLAQVISSIHELCKDPDNTVVIFSGSETVKLEEMFATLPVWLAAENGVYVRPPNHLSRKKSLGLPLGSQEGQGREGGSWVALFDTINREWMEAVHTVLDYFCERTPR